jgi:hypothetical protein
MEPPFDAMVLVNGQLMFSCGGEEDLDIGEYELVVPLNANGEITLFLCVDGFRPYKQIFSP